MLRLSKTQFHLCLQQSHSHSSWILRGFATFSLALCAALAPRTLQAQAPVTVSTSVSLDDPGRPVATTTGTTTPAFHPSRVLVRFRNGAPHDFLPGSGPARAFPGDPNLFLVPNPPGLAVAEAVRRYQANPNVLYAEPDFVVQAIFTPNDPLWNPQGGTYDMAKIAAPTAWDTQTDSSDVYAVVIDTGIDFTHPDFCVDPPACLQSNLDSADSFTCMNGTCVPAGQPGGGGVDDFGHGTHVAGTIGAVGNNGIGIAGINWKVKIISCKFLGSGGSGQISDAVLCFNKVAALKQQGLNIRLTSNSWGGGGFSQALVDAMKAVEAAGIVNVCAAGNSNVNADASPMYPAAYDNLGIISVLASDQNDVGAGFTNYGLFSVDIGAPGVSTLSTVPTTTCTLCDPSGYKLLSGTSMATPHVSGVLAALFHQHLSLNAYEARDIVLDPASYDTPTDPKAQTTSTGGRLNFPKTLANPRLNNPIVLNNFPTLTMGPDVFASAGSQVSLTASASDSDGDTLRMAWAKPSISAGSLWLFGWMLNTLFPNPPSSGGSFSFPAPSLARTATVPYDASVADGRGGGAHGRDNVTVSPSPTPGLPPSGTLTVTPPNPNPGDLITVNFPATDPEGSTVAWDFWIGQNHGASGSCCYTGSSTSTRLNNVGVYRFRTQAIDKELNLGDNLFEADKWSAVVRVGSATGDPPIARASLDKLSGPVPLTVNINMGASSDPDGTIQYYFIGCGLSGFTPASTIPTGSCNYTTPGTYWLMLQVQDNSGNMDLISAYVVATPVPPGPDTTPPTVSITSPTSGANVSGNVPITANASDDASGVNKVEFHLDTPSGTLLGTDTTSPYGITWDSSTTTPGMHTLYAVATDNSGNSANSTGVTITVVDKTPPTVSITSPAPNGHVSGNVSITADASDGTGSGVNKVDFYLDTPSGVPLGTDSTSPYGMTWNSCTTSTGSHTLYAVATDNAANVGNSPGVAITVDAAAVSMKNPKNGDTVTRRSTVTMMASVTSSCVPVARVDYLVSSSVVCSGTTGPDYSCPWTVPAAANKSYSIQAKAYDANGLLAVSPTVTVTSK